MIYLKLRQAGEIVNHKRVDRLYAQAGLQVKKRKRKKIPLADRPPLERPMAANQVWSMDFVFDRTAEGRSIKNLTVVDDATHEAVAIVPERAMGGHQLVRILDQLATTRGLPKAIRTDNGKEFCGRVMLNWAHSKGVQLFLIEPGKPNQNAYIESFNGRFKDECLNEHWFTSMAHARVSGIHPQTQKVILLIAPKVADYFKRRQLIPHQKILAESTDGALTVETTVGHQNQILPIVRYWIPCMRIVSPMAWNDELINQLADYLTCIG